MNTSRMLHGRYEVGDLIGFGATADVYGGRDVHTGRLVAIKVLRAHLARSELLHSNFQGEASTLAELDHPAVVAFYDAGHEEIDDDSVDRPHVPYIVMEHVAGRSLRDIIMIGGLTLAESIHYQLAILAALGVCHRAGIVHRDIKPANVMVSTEGAVKLVDFGLARRGSDSDATSTLARAFLGTPSYISPEQVGGGSANARSDVYSAGCVLHELLTGSPPFVGDDPISVAYQHVHERPAPVNTGILAVDSVLMESLAKEPRDRFEDARSFRESLRAAAKGIAQVEPGLPVRHLHDNVPAPLVTGARPAVIRLAY